jgi:hypothetical protein
VCSSDLEAVDRYYCNNEKKNNTNTENKKRAN